MSDNGWTDDFLGLEWFQKSFIPQATERNTSGKPILLILDGHGSHESVKIIDLALTHNIMVLCLPPHTTHMLQPLDVGVFGPFAREWSEECDRIVDETLRKPQSDRHSGRVDAGLSTPPSSMTITLHLASLQRFQLHTISTSLITKEAMIHLHLIRVMQNSMLQLKPCDQPLTPMDLCDTSQLGFLRKTTEYRLSRHRQL